MPRGYGVAISRGLWDVVSGGWLTVSTRVVVLVLLQFAASQGLRCACFGEDRCN